MCYGIGYILCVVPSPVAFLLSYFFVFKKKPAYEWRISDWSSDVCSSDLVAHPVGPGRGEEAARPPRQHRIEAVQHGGDRHHGDRHGGELRPDGEPRVDELREEGGIEEYRLGIGDGDHHALPEHRTEERRVGNKWVSQCKSRWCPVH